MSGITVMKFGGTSQGTMEKMNCIAKQINDYVDDGNKVLMVVSAPSREEPEFKTTDELIAAIEAAYEHGRITRPEEPFRLLDETYRNLGGIKNVKDPREACFGTFSAMLNAIKYLQASQPAKSADENGEQKTFYSAYVQAQGERYQAALMSELLNDYGMRANWIDFNSRMFPVRVQGDIFHAFPNLEKSRKAGSKINWHDTDVYVIPGYAGIEAQPAAESRIKLLGRGGSDISAFICLYALNGDACYICTDVSGIKRGPYKNAEHIPELDVVEARYAGALKAKLPNPRTVAPLEKMYSENSNPRAYIVSADDIFGENTRIIRTAEKKEAVKLVGSREISTFHLRGRGYLALPRELDRIGVDACSTCSWGDVVIGVIDGERLAERKINEFIKTRQIEPVYTEDQDGVSRYIRDLCMVGAVGSGMVGKPGVSSTIYNTLAENGINVYSGFDMAVSYFTAVLVVNADQERATRVLYDKYHDIWLGRKHEQENAMVGKA